MANTRIAPERILFEKNDIKVNDKVREISIETENEDVIHTDITDNETEKYGYL